MATTFYLVEHAGDFDYQFLTAEQYWHEREVTGDRISCKHLEAITVKDEQAALEWQTAYDSFVQLAWTPNQSQDERNENVPLIKVAQNTMKRLQDEVIESPV
jgi:hypothetical protein